MCKQHSEIVDKNHLIFAMKNSPMFHIAKYYVLRIYCMYVSVCKLCIIVSESYLLNFDLSDFTFNRLLISLNSALRLTGICTVLCITNLKRTFLNIIILTKRTHCGHQRSSWQYGRCRQVRRGSTAPSQHHHRASPIDSSGRRCGRRQHHNWTGSGGGTVNVAKKDVLVQKFRKALIIISGRRQYKRSSICITLF